MINKIKQSDPHTRQGRHNAVGSLTLFGLFPVLDTEALCITDLLPHFSLGPVTRVTVTPSAFSRIAASSDIMRGSEMVDVSKDIFSFDSKY